MKKKDPTSHRIIEKRRRDRMNNCLADLSKLIPVHYMKKGRGRIEKTEIIEMAIKHLKDLIESSKAQQKHQHQQQHQQQQQQHQQQVEQSEQTQSESNNAQMTSSEHKFSNCLSSSTSSMSSFAPISAPGPSSERSEGATMVLMCQDDLQATKANPMMADNRVSQFHKTRQAGAYLSVGQTATTPVEPAQMNGFISAQDVQHLANVNKTTSKEIKIEPSSSTMNMSTSVTPAAATGPVATTADAAATTATMMAGTLSPSSSYYNHYHGASNHHHHHHHHHHGNSGSNTTSTSISNNDGTTNSGAGSSGANHHHHHKYRSSANLSSSTSSGSDSGGSSSSLGSSYGAGGGGNKSSNGESSSGHRSAGSSSSMRTSCSSSSVTAMNMSGLVVDRGTTTSLNNITGNVDNDHNNSGLKSISSDPMVAGTAKQPTSIYPTGAGGLPQPGPVPMIITATNALNHSGPLECCACGARIIALNQANNNSGSNSDSSISSNDNLSISPNNQSDTSSQESNGKVSSAKRETGNSENKHRINSTSEPAQARLNGQSNGDTSSPSSSSMSSSNSNSPPSSSSSSSSSSAWYKKAWLVRSFSRSPAMR